MTASDNVTVTNASDSLLSVAGVDLAPGQGTDMPSGAVSGSMRLLEKAKVLTIKPVGKAKDETSK